VPRSKEELLLAFELASFLPFDIDEHKLQIDDRLLDVDMLLWSYKIAVEYDGSFWHRGKEHTDRDKTRALERAGWTVIRVREEPLSPLGPHDVVVPLGNLKEAANRLIEKVLTLARLSNDAFPGYVKRKSLKNARAANAYIKDLIDRKAPYRATNSSGP
jgi:hypothetical protein